LIEIGEYGEHSSVADVFSAEVHLGEDAMDVFLDSAFREEERLADPEIGSTLCHQDEHFSLSGREEVQRVLRSPGQNELVDERRVDD
jgi:hypothetical protein